MYALFCRQLLETTRQLCGEEDDYMIIIHKVNRKRYFILLIVVSLYTDRFEDWLLFRVTFAFCAGKYFVKKLSCLLIAGDVKEHHHSSEDSVEDGEASIQGWILGRFKC